MKLMIEGAKGEIADFIFSVQSQQNNLNNIIDRLSAIECYILKERKEKEEKLKAN